MGSAQSSNVAQAVTNVSNFVSNSTTANASQVSQVSQEVDLNDCYIQLTGNFDVNNSANLLETNNQIVSGMQDANLNNNIQQQMLQEATSKVGFLGIGYASASNSANEMINSTTQITNDMNVSASQYGNVNEKFECDRSTIIADNLNIGFYSNSDFLSSQTLNNSQTAKIVNNVSQSVTQKATATVEGIGALLLALLLILAVIIYGVGKPLSSGAAKVAVASALAFGLTGIIVFMYIRNTSPFFSQPSNCINHSAIGMGTGSDVPNCINMTNQKLNLASPPTKYIYPILPGVYSKSGGNLLQMVIAQISGQSKTDAGPNGGYRVDTYNNLQNKINQYQKYATKLNIANIPNPLSVPSTGDTNNPYYAIPIEYISGLGSGGSSGGSLCTPGTASVGDSSDPTDFTICYQGQMNGQNNGEAQTYPYGRPFSPAAFQKTNLPAMGVANINLQGWNSYLSNDDTNWTKTLFARFVLCDMIGNIDLHHWVLPNELIKFIGDDNKVVVDVATTNGKPTYPNDTYFFRPNNSVGDWSLGVDSVGYIEGNIGVLDDRQYKFEQFMKKIGVWILAGILAAILGYMFFTHKKKDKTDSSAPATSKK